MSVRRPLRSLRFAGLLPPAFDLQESVERMLRGDARIRLGFEPVLQATRAWQLPLALLAYHVPRVLFAGAPRVGLEPGVDSAAASLADVAASRRLSARFSAPRSAS